MSHTSFMSITGYLPRLHCLVQQPPFAIYTEVLSTKMITLFAQSIRATLGYAAQPIVA